MFSISRTISFCLCIVFLRLCYSEKLASHRSRSLSSTCLQFPDYPVPQLQTTIPANSEVCVDVPDISPTVRYFILEAHSHKFNVTLSYVNSSKSIGNAISGTGVGLVGLVDAGATFDPLWVFNTNGEDLNVVLTVVFYQDKDPIAGGCNMEFPIEISPFLRVQYNRANTRLEFQHAQLGYPSGSPVPICSESTNFISYKFYLYFLPERDFSEETYFKSMALMQTVSSIRRNAREVEPFIVTPRTRAIFMSYPGQGVIFNIIAQSIVDGEYYEAAYTPMATYGCSFDSSIDGCGRLTGPFGKILALVLAVFGFFVIIRGHRFLTIEMAYFGFLAGAFVTFVLLAKYSSVTETDRDVLTVAGGVLVAIIWAAVWWVFGIPVLSVLLVGFELGFLLTAVIYFTPLGDAELFRSDFNYWMIMACGMLAIPVLLLPTTRMLSIIGSSVVGSYFIVVAIDRFTGSTISYIVLNVVKRALSEDSSLASNVYSFQQTDIILSVLWAVLALFGTVLQRYTERHRAPFPPAPRKTWRREWQQRRERRLARLASLERNSNGERTPLIGSSLDPHYDSTVSYNSR